jgi:hypothetical protein
MRGEDLHTLDLWSTLQDHPKMGLQVGTPTSLKSSRPLSRFGEADPPHWVEQLDLLRRLDGCHDDDEDDGEVDHGVLPNAVQNNAGEADLLGLQSEIDKSEEELSKTDSVEQGICYSDVQGLEMVTGVPENAEKDKDEEPSYVHKELQEKQNEESVETKRLLQDAEDADLRTDENGMPSEEANETQPEIASLQFQLKVAIQEFIRATCLSVACTLQQGVDDRRATMSDHEENLEDLKAKEYDHDQTAKEMEYTEMLKRQYFAALIAAREKPREETLALAAELRERLKSVLAIPSFSSFGR